MSPLSERVLPALHGIAAETGGSTRAGQDAMALAVARAIEEHQHIVVQATTGTGKSRAGVLPFAMARIKLIVSTFTRALQDQYAEHDLPSIVRWLAANGYGNLMVAVLKGRANYPCLLACDTALAGDQQLFEDGHVGAGTKAIARWALQAEPGVEWGAAPMPVSTAQRVELSVTPDECVGKRCAFFDECHSEHAKREAKLADIVVVSHALLCAHVAHGGNLIPVEEDRLVGFLVDEAHMLETAAEGAFGASLAFRPSASGEVHGTLADLATALDKLGIDSTLAESLRFIGQAFYDITDNLLGGDRVKDRGLTAADRAEHYGRAIDALAEAVQNVAWAVDRWADRGDYVTDAEALQLMRITAKLERCDQVVKAFRSAGLHIVTHVERAGRGVRVVATDLNCGPYLAARAWHTPAGYRRPVVLASATIPANYVHRVGIQAETFEVDSPFDLAHRQLIWVADSLPSPSKARPAWEQQAPQVAFEVAARALHTGSVLVLCTSWRMVEQYDTCLMALRQVHPGVRLIVDSQHTSTADCVAAFAAADRAVLVSAQGAWTGVDLPGKVRAVIIPAVPMPVPGAPLNEARKAMWPSGQLPHAIDRATAAMMLTQGAGRLVRCSTDWGLVAILDQRVLRSNYAADLRSKLPRQSVIVGDEYRAEVFAWLERGPLQ